MSTLKEKLEQYIDPQINVVHLEKIADDYAIEFAEWVSNKGFKKYSNGWAKLWDKGLYTSKELLEIFKKENGY